MTNELLSRVRADSIAHTTPRDTEMTTELLSRVTRGFDRPDSPKGLRNHQGTAVTGDAWIRQPRQPPTESQISDELLSRVTRGFESPHSP
jgi:hypothetical protein